MHIYPQRMSLQGLEVEILKLVSYSASPEQWKEWLRVPLEHAAARGNLDLFNKLLEAGADGSDGWRGCRNRTLLDAAAVGGNEEVVSALLLAGAQPDVNVVSASPKRSALYTATVLGHEAIARCLLVAGANVNFHDPVRQSSVLFEATRGGHRRLVTELLIGGADPDCRSRYGNPLHVAAYNGLYGVVSTLLLRGADKDALDDDGGTPLMWASKQGHVSVVKILLARGADVRVRDTEQISALDRAAMSGYGDVVDVIAGHGTDVNAQNSCGFAALHYAAQFDQAGAVDALIEAGADVDLKEHADGSSPLSMAAFHGRSKSMFALLQHGAKVDVRDYVSYTPLHDACFGRREGLEAVVDLLLRWGADETALDDEGKSPAEVLNVENEEYFEQLEAKQDEINRAQILLARAPADRAWRRRGWLVMLRSRSSMAMTGEGGESKFESSESMASVEYDGPRKTSSGVGSGAEAKGREGVPNCAAGQLGLAKEGAMHTESGEGCVVGGEGGEEGLRLEVLPLLGVGLEGVFRAVVGFL